MTREQKLALLIGFALVLVVGVVVSDHLSGASQAQLEAVVEDEPIPGATGPISLPDAGPPVDQYAASPSPDPRSQTATTPRQTEQPGGPRPVASSGPPATSGSSALKDLLRRGMDGARDIVDNISEAPVAAQSDSVITSPLPEDAGPIAINMGEPARMQRTAGSPLTYIVKEGDSLWAIAQRIYGDGSLHEPLARHNKDRVGAGGTVYKGATLLIPSKDVLLGRAAPARDEAVRASEASQDQPGRARRYTVQKGDTLGEIASRLLGSARRWPEIVKLNSDVIDDPDNVPAGVVLKLPSN